MSNRSTPFQVRIRGDLACFTRPEMKVERFSYEIITPSAARGVIEAVLWKPAITWRIDRIALLAPVVFTSFKRNEVKQPIPLPSKRQMNDTGGVSRFLIEEEREQRNTVALRDVDYAVTAHFEMTDVAGPEDTVKKFEEMFCRRLERGQYYHHPYLGCREFSATVERYVGTPQPLALDKELGLMLMDKDYSVKGQPGVFFDAVLVGGILMKREGGENYDLAEVV